MQKAMFIMMGSMMMAAISPGCAANSRSMAGRLFNGATSVAPGFLGMLRKLDHLVGAGQADVREDGHPAARGADRALDQAHPLGRGQVQGFARVQRQRQPVHAMTDEEVAEPFRGVEIYGVGAGERGDRVSDHATDSGCHLPFSS